MSIDIIAGHYYKTRNGKVVGPMRSHSSHTTYYWETNVPTEEGIKCWTWTRDGRFRVFDESPEDIVKEVFPKSYPNASSFLNEESNPTEEKPMTVFTTITETAKSLREKIRPYDKYIIMAAIVIAIDYFVFDGKISEKTKEIFKKLSNKLVSTLDRVIDKLGD